MTEIDLKRSVPAKLVHADKWGSLEPGECIKLVDGNGGSVIGLLSACPGCGEPLSLDFVRERPGHPRWNVSGGDPAKPETLSLSPSILHDPSKGACGWHGYLTNGVFTPC